MSKPVLSLVLQIDHFERAKRLAEIPLLEAQYEKQKEEDEAFFKQQQETKVGALDHLCLLV